MSSAREDQTVVNIRCAERAGKAKEGAVRLGSPILFERCHQGLGNRPLEGVPKPSAGVVLRHERLGGIVGHYYRQAA